MPEIERAFRNHTHVGKIRIAKFVTHAVNSNIPEIMAHDGKMNTVLGLLEKGDMNCAGNEISNDLFVNPEGRQESTTEDLHREPRPISETIGRGIVQTEAEKLKAEEEARRRRELEEEEARKKAETEEERMAAERKENSILNKTLKFLKKFGSSIISGEE